MNKPFLFRFRRECNSNINQKDLMYYDESTDMLISRIGKTLIIDSEFSIATKKENVERREGADQKFSLL